MRLMGIAGFLIPLASLLAAATLQPTLLSFYGRRGVARRSFRLLPQEPADVEQGILGVARPFDHAEAAALSRRRLRHRRGAHRSRLLALADAGLVVRVPRTPEAIRGFDSASQRAGGLVPRSRPGSSSTRVGRSAFIAPSVGAAARQAHLSSSDADPETAAVLFGAGAAIRRSPRRAMPRSCNSGGTTTASPRRSRSCIGCARGSSPRGAVPGRRAGCWRVERHPRASTSCTVVFTTFPWVISRRPRAHLRPAAARLPVAAAATEGDRPEPPLGRRELRNARRRLPVRRRPRHRSGCTATRRSRAGSRRSCSPPCSACRWTTRCSSVTRMRELWDAGADNTTAVAHGLERTGPLVTAAALIMIAAFSGLDRRRSSACRSSASGSPSRS